MLTQLVYSNSEAENNVHYQFLLGLGLWSVIDYYNSNWHPIRHQRVECFKGANFTMGEKTNNHLECINSKVKRVCSKYASLDTFFWSILCCPCLPSKMREITQRWWLWWRKELLSSQKSQAKRSLLNCWLHMHWTMSKKQLALRKKAKTLEDQGENYTVSSSTGTLMVTAESCQCNHASCRHIRSEGEDAFTSI